MLNSFKKMLVILSLFLILTLAFGLVSASQDADMKINSSDSINENNDNVQIGIEGNGKIGENVSNTISINGGNFDDIQNAVDGASAGDTLNLSGNFTGIGKTIKISKNLTIKGNAILDAKNLSGIFNFIGENMSLCGLTFINSNNDKGAIFTYTNTDDFLDDEFDFSNSNFLKISIVNCTFKNNIGRYAGALTIYNYDTSIINSIFSNNIADNAGAVNIRHANVSVSNCIFTDNIANFNPDISYSDNGYFNAAGAVSISGEASVYNSKFINNAAKTNYEGGSAAGALFVTSNCNIENCCFEKNSVKGSTSYLDGGAFFHFSYDSYCNILNSTFINNQASSSEARGAAITSSSSNPCYILNCNFKGNYLKTYDHDGGAIFAYDSVVKNCNFMNNAADWGGAVSSDKLYIFNCSFSNNYAKQYGGAILSYNGNVNNCIFTNNSAKKHGGTIYSQHSITVANSNFNKNSVQGYGSAVAVWSDEGEIKVSNCMFSNNIAKADGSTYNYPYENYGNGAIFHLGYSNKFKCSIINSKGINKNADKFKRKTKIVVSKVSKVTKGKYLTVKLTDRMGNSIKGMKIIIKLKGKKYKRTTDKKGKVKLLIKLPAKKYSSKITFNGNNFLAKSSKTIKVIVKK